MLIFDLDGILELLKTLRLNVERIFVSSGYISVKKSAPLEGSVKLDGAKNAVLAIMASLLLTSGKSILKNVPAISDV